MTTSSIGFRANIFNNSNLFLIALDSYIRSLTMLYSSDNLRYYIESYYKASFIKVLDIMFINAMFLNGFINSFKPLIYNL